MGVGLRKESGKEPLRVFDLQAKVEAIKRKTTSVVIEFILVGGGVTFENY